MTERYVRDKPIRWGIIFFISVFLYTPYKKLSKNKTWDGPRTYLYSLWNVSLLKVTGLNNRIKYKI